jgi:MFS family permease
MSLNRADPSGAASRLAVVFSSLGHLYIHLCTAFYFVIVLALEQQWSLPYHELIELWTLGSLLVGVAALPAGLLSDRLGASVMMIVFFVGMGGSSIAAGMTRTPTQLMIALAGIGLFAAIYHPVGIPWLVRNTKVARGKALGINGVFGAVGSAGAGIVAGALIDSAGWRAAFVVPGVVCFVTGLALLGFWLRGRMRETPTAESETSGAESSGSRRVFPILLTTMFIAGLIFHGTQTSLPKFFEQRSQGLAGDGAFGIGVLVAVVYGVAGLMQVLGGHLADRFSLKWVYVGALFIQVPALWLASILSGLPLVLIATMMVMANASALPAENLLLAHHTPARHHGLAFGLKFVLSFGAAPLAVALVAFVTRRTGDLSVVYVLLAVAGVAALAAAMLLPRERPEHAV